MDPRYTPPPLPIFETRCFTGEECLLGVDVPVVVVPVAVGIDVRRRVGVIMEGALALDARGGGVGVLGAVPLDVFGVVGDWVASNFGPAAGVLGVAVPDALGPDADALGAEALGALFSRGVDETAREARMGVEPREAVDAK